MGLVYNCSGRVNIIRKGRNVTGFIVDENGQGWKVKLSSTNEVLQVPKVKYVWNKLDGGRYIYPFSATNGMRVTTYWPIWMKFQKNGVDNWSFLLNCTVYMC